MDHKFLVHNKRDNVGVAVADIKKGEKVKGYYLEEGEWIELEALDDIPLGHKIALQDLVQRDLVIKYGEVIGEAVKEIKKGEHVHIHNIKSRRW
ncbi:MAG: UxaA family hydrolase [Dictyoglomaceae bacterium]